MFETDFLTENPESAGEYLRQVAQAAELLVASLPSGPYNGKTPGELASLIENDVLPASGRPSDQIAGLLRTIVSNSVRVNHPRTAAHLHCPPLLATLAAEVVISGLNQSMDSFDQAPIATMVEQRMTRWLCSQAGLPSTADGTFTTGGSQSNYMGLLLARDAYLHKKWNWSGQKSGLPPEARRLRILCSETAHFTVEKSASQLGLGTDAVVRVDVDEGFCMKPQELRETIQKLLADELLPMAVIATAGTTDFGSIDPLPEVSAIAKQSGAWFHVDAAYGGALLFSGLHKNRIHGIDQADSITIDFHKLFWQPIPCSVFLLREAKHFDLIKVNSDYLNPEAHEDAGIPNLVTTSLLTSRRFDALKLWISFQALGRSKLGAMIDRAMELALSAAEMIRHTARLELVCEPQLSTVVFRYVPDDLSKDVDELNAALSQRLFDRGIAVIGHTRVRGRQCLKFTFMNPAVSEDEVKGLLQAIVEQGNLL